MFLKTPIANHFYPNSLKLSSLLSMVLVASTINEFRRESALGLVLLLLYYYYITVI